MQPLLGTADARVSWLPLAVGSLVTLGAAWWTRQFALVGAAATAGSVMVTGYWGRYERVRMVARPRAGAQPAVAWNARLLPALMIGATSAGSGLALGTLWSLRTTGIPAATVALLKRVGLPFLTIATAVYIAHSCLADDDKWSECRRRVEVAAPALLAITLSVGFFWREVESPTSTLVGHGLTTLLGWAVYSQVAKKVEMVKRSEVASGMPDFFRGEAVATCVLSAQLLLSRWAHANLWQSSASTITQAGLAAFSLGYLGYSAMLKPNEIK
jgi:hypothetical protein